MKEVKYDAGGNVQVLGSSDTFMFHPLHIHSYEFAQTSHNGDIFCPSWPAPVEF